MVSNQQQWEHFSNYIDVLIEQQHRSMEQADNVAIINRSQGAIYMLRRLQKLRDEVLKQG